MALCWNSENKKDNVKAQDYLDFILDIREYDVPYHVRFAIDNGEYCGSKVLSFAIFAYETR